ncbi:hypothetical protein BJ878DRAFT_501261 [Calycina marina]|uniref:RRM domain-containing protein n=1 Tax=Calycina marina TaxID=1763456 RepID=A0A9P7Z4K9_9HELO|nr:hypothetical protein BJ878DRAFT_501261 [Calycina marina]
MVKDVESKKRKASTGEHGAEKLKKAKKVVGDAPVALEKKRQPTEDVAPIKIKIKSPRAPEPSVTSEAKNLVEEAVETLDADKAVDAPKGLKSALKKNGKSATKSKKTKEPKTVKVAKPVEEDTAMADEDQDEIDDQTEELLKGFESDGDEEDAMKEVGLEAGQDVPRIPLSKKEKKKLKRDAEIEASEKPGVLYIGRIPHGFYEHEMREYFKQFGTILKLRLSRNPKTGNSRHFAFIQFESTGVAEIIAKTMDNYLLLGHILKVKQIPDEQVHADLFNGANKRFKKVPWNKIQGRALKEGKSEEVWDAKANKENEKRKSHADKLKSIGYEFTAPELKSAKGIAKPTLPELAAAESIPAVEAVVQAVEAALVEESLEPKRKKAKKSKKEAEPAATATETIVTQVVTEAPVTDSRVSVVKKEKKVKNLVDSEDTTKIEAAVKETVTEAPVSKKAKKTKKRKLSDA